MKVYISCSLSSPEAKTDFFVAVEKAIKEHYEYCEIVLSQIELGKKWIIRHCDIMIAEVSENSMSVGVDIGIAEAFVKPTFFFYLEGTQYYHIPESLSLVFNEKRTNLHYYNNPQCLEYQLDKAIHMNKTLEQIRFDPITLEGI